MKSRHLLLAGAVALALAACGKSEAPADAAAPAAAPVSYTHLDVYKRQVYRPGDLWP